MPPLQHILLDNYYRSKKALEPTAHTELFYRFQDQWGPYKAAIDRKREEQDLDKKGAKGAKGRRKSKGR